MLSRVAENLYWMARHLERAEHAARLLDVNLNLMLDQATLSGDARWDRVLASLGLDPEDLDSDDPYAITRAVAFDTANPTSVVSAIAAARENARQVRQQISGDMFEQLNAMFWQVRRTSFDDIWRGQPSDFFRSIRSGASLFHGLTDTTMDHGEEWQFIQLGRSLECCAGTSRLLTAYFAEDPESGGDGFEAGEYLRWVSLLKSCTAFEPYLKAYQAAIKSEHVAEFLLLEPRFPRSVRYAADRIVAALAAIEELTGTRRGARAQRLAGRLQAALEYGQTEEILASGITAYLASVERQCGEIHNASHRTYIGYPIEEVAA